MASDKITSGQVLFPLSLLSFVVLIMLAFQTHAMVNDHDALSKAKADQVSQLEQTEKVKTQVNALAVGTLKLSEKGNKDAQTIIAEMKKAGIQVGGEPPQGAPGAAPAPVAPPAP
ncbi:MAG: hypothetical protein P4M15_00990 [Alphaproteobacteria bacterium]|nr:hypothetical protein [Alphaproteobacteria bacterium]